MNLDFGNITQKDHRFWIISVSLIAGTTLLFLGGHDYNSPRSFAEFWNIGHILYFVLVSYALTRWKQITHRPLIIQWLLVLSITLITGVLIEVLQYGAQRTPDIGDVIRDLTGSFLFLSFSPVSSRVVIYKRKMILQAAAVILLLAQLQPLATSLFDETVARQQFPLLAGFETPFELDRWQGDANIAIKHISSISDGNILQISLSTTRYSGVNLRYFPRDWRNYKALKLSIYNPQTLPLLITCRIHDMQHTQGIQQYSDRFNHRFLLSQGWNNIEIDLDDVASAPKHRKMDLGKIRGLGIFVTSLPQAQTIFLDNIKLVP